jgi:hypothetical protein
MKTQRQFPLQPGGRAIQTADTGHPESSPNSSVIFGVSVAADIDDVLAVIRTAMLLAKSFKISTRVDLPEEEPIFIEPAGDPSQVLQRETLEIIQGKLRIQGASQETLFAVEASITNASFLTAGTISLRIRATDSVVQRPIVAR